MSNASLPLRQHEATQIQFLLGLISECKHSEEILGKRLAATGDAERFREISAEMSAIADRVLGTVDVEKLLILRKNMLHQEMRIVTKGPADASRYEWTLVPSQALRALFATAARWECKTCNGGPNEMAGCQYRKTLKQMMMFDPKDENGECFGQRLEWDE